MSNRRDLKKNINVLMSDVIEECYDSLLNNEGKNEKEVEALVDEAVDLADDLIGKVNDAKKFKGKEAKKHFAKIKEELGDKVIVFMEKLDKL
jgi:hypothetical protein